MFFFLPVGINYRTARLPVVTFTLMGLNTLIWLITAICSQQTGGESDDWVMTHLWLAPATSPFYSWLTSMFVHEGFLHLFGNMLFLFLFGCCVEDMVGRWRFLLLYLAGGFAAEIIFLAISPGHFGSQVPLGGASGAISACMGMFLWLRADVEIEFLYFIWFFGIHGGRYEVPAWVAIGFWFVKDLFWMVLGMMYPHVIGGGVAFGAHVGGLLTGLALLALFRIKPPPPEEEPQQPTVQDARAAVASAARLKMAAATATMEPVAGAARVAGETPTIFLAINGAQSGPHTLSSIQTRLARHEIPSEALYWSEGMTEWASVNDLAGGMMG